MKITKKWFSTTVDVTVPELRSLLELDTFKGDLMRLFVDNKRDIAMTVAQVMREQNQSIIDAIYSKLPIMPDAE